MLIYFKGPEEPVAKKKKVLELVDELSTRE